MGESTQGYGGAAPLQGGAVSGEGVLRAACGHERFIPRVQGPFLDVLPDGRLVKVHSAITGRFTVLGSIWENVKNLPGRISAEPYRYLAIEEADLKRERMLAGVNYRMQFFREAA